MVEKTLILKQISGMLCLLNSYSKFTRPNAPQRLTVAEESVTVKTQKGILPIDGQSKFNYPKKESNRILGLGGYFFCVYACNQNGYNDSKNHQNNIGGFYRKLKHLWSHLHSRWFFKRLPYSQKGTWIFISMHLTLL